MLLNEANKVRLMLKFRNLSTNCVFVLDQLTEACNGIFSLFSIYDILILRINAHLFYHEAQRPAQVKLGYVILRTTK